MGNEGLLTSAGKKVSLPERGGRVSVLGHTRAARGTIIFTSRMAAGKPAFTRDANEIVARCVDTAEGGEQKEGMKNGAVQYMRIQP